MSTSLSANSVVVASRNQVSCDLKGEAAVLNLKNGVYYGLESVGAFVWSLVQRPRSVGELRDALLQEYDVEPGRCESDLLALLQKLLAEGLIELKSEAIPSASPSS
jgi:hypothetical protein